MILAIGLIVVFFLLSLIHFYWAMGGQWGMDASLPTNEQGVRVLNPKRTDSVIVGIALAFFSLFYLLKSGTIEHQIPSWIISVGQWTVPGIFLLRAIGDFKYVGFFRKIKSTKFGKMDTMFFTPLCFLLALFGLLIAIQ
ncbi:MAG TPA: DUF3995 domain-containing protein [Saprospiraceae bacterium]|nr:DUF3995 domain-containing protein [Saprospiraceae bacterium]